ncbi:MAG: maleylpyruvate isomerase N-terminal domain-containing protein [Nocardioidaceae bacterium]
MTHSTTQDSLTALSRASAATGQLIDGIRADQWGVATGCPGWTVRDLARRLAALLGRSPQP